MWVDTRGLINNRDKKQKITYTDILNVLNKLECSNISHDIKKETNWTVSWFIRFNFPLEKWVVNHPTSMFFYQPIKWKDDSIYECYEWTDYRVLENHNIEEVIDIFWSQDELETVHLIMRNYWSSVDIMKIIIKELWGWYVDESDWDSIEYEEVI